MDPICPVDCSTNLPVVSFDKCNPAMVASEITKFYIAKPSAAPFTDVEDPLEWAKRLSETNTVPVTSPTNTTPVGDLIRPLTVIGNRPVPTATTKDLSNRRTKTLFKEFIINIKIDEITPENLELQRSTECGSLVKAWYAIQGGLLFGGNDGMEGELKLDLQLDEGSDAIVAIVGTFTRKGIFTEESTTNPIAEAA